ncbi:GNAT family N-acetyltransferase [Scytonema sp. UIC 10036]|uniref:GNAT family N-acetyltransferase n=1 Tax=Scytonema sp. UIC 10036 TaxID=2304196 RepID=UPI0012DA5DC1|nr:GNAT family N-acetyltransferase [Scytonema sp. UIC 10036]MUG99804.1 GNAT family N-acetyltransferase [Scytonema sp. UIC 10036]
MPIEQQIIIKEATVSEDFLIAKHFYRMWLDLGVPEDAIAPDWLNITLEFVEQARQELSYKAFVAEIEGAVVGSTSCQLYSGLYPNIIKQQHRKYGYIWGVYVEPSYRRQGIAKQLTTQAVTHLKEIGCTRVLLNASPLGKPVYESLGFSSSNAMQLDL